jgi:hypothetical protein
VGRPKEFDHIGLLVNQPGGRLPYEEYCLRNTPPARKDTTARTRKTKNTIFANPTNEPAIPPKPNKAAIRAMTSNPIANCNIVKSSFNKDHAAPDKPRAGRQAQKKTDVVEHQVFHHVGLLSNGPPGTTGLAFI